MADRRGALRSACSPTSIRGCTAAGTRRSRATRSSSRRAALRRASRQRAIDLGAGCGFQAIPLARLGFSVTAIDLDRKLLAELKRTPAARRSRRSARIIVDFRRHAPQPVELVVCMVDTLLHLASQDAVDAAVRRRLRGAGARRHVHRDVPRLLRRERRSSTASSPCAATSTRSSRASSSSSPPPSRCTISSIGASTGAGTSRRASTASCVCRRPGSSSTLRAAGFEKVETGLDRGLVVVTATK